MTEMTELEVRAYPRKVFRCRAKLLVEDKLPMRAWTVDISIGGISLMLAEPIDPGQYCIVKFDAVVDGISRRFSAMAKSIYSVCSYTGKYRTGFQFPGLSMANASFIDKLEG